MAHGCLCFGVIFLYTFNLTILYENFHINKAIHLKSKFAYKFLVEVSWYILYYFVFIWIWVQRAISRFHAIPKLDNCMFLKYIFSEAGVVGTTNTSCFYTIILLKFINQGGLSFLVDLLFHFHILLLFSGALNFCFVLMWTQHCFENYVRWVDCNLLWVDMEGTNRNRFSMNRCLIKIFFVY